MISQVICNFVVLSWFVSCINYAAFLLFFVFVLFSFLLFLVFVLLSFCNCYAYAFVLFLLLTASLLTQHFTEQSEFNANELLFLQ